LIGINDDEESRLMRTWEIHPAVVHFPIAFLLGGVVLDLFGLHSEAAIAAATYWLLAGLATGAVAAVTGVVSYYTVPGNHTEQAHQRVYWHIGAMVTAVVMFAVVCFVRWQHPSVVSPAIRGLGLAAAAILIFGGYVGGKLVYQGGLGIEPTILKPDLRSRSAATNVPPASPTGPVMPIHVGEAAKR
jgi:uncharacterized membrane protein